MSDLVDVCVQNHVFDHLAVSMDLASPKRALTGKGEVVVSGDVAYDPLALAGGRTGAHCTACLIWQYPALTLGIGLF